MLSGKYLDPDFPVPEARLNKFPGFYSRYRTPECNECTARYAKIATSVSDVTRRDVTCIQPRSIYSLFGRVIYHTHRQSAPLPLLQSTRALPLNITILFYCCFLFRSNQRRTGPQVDNMNISRIDLGRILQQRSWRLVQSVAAGLSSFSFFVAVFDSVGAFTRGSRMV